MSMKQTTTPSPSDAPLVLPPVNGKTETATIERDPMLLSDVERQGLMAIVNNINNSKVTLFDLELRRSQIQQEMDLHNRALAGVLFGYARARGIERDLAVSPDMTRLIFKE